MKILFLTRNFPNKYNPREGAVVYRQAKELINLGHEVIVVSPVPYVPSLISNIKSKWLEYSKLPINAIENNIVIYRPRYISFPMKALSSFSWKFIQLNILSIIADIYIFFEFDLIHAHMGYPEGKVGEKLKDKYNVPLITTFRSSDLDININNTKIRSYLEDTLLNSDVIIVPSVPLKRKIRKISLDKEIKIIGNGTDMNNKVELDNKLNIKYKEKKVVLSVSRLINSKGIATNIKAIKKLISKIPNIYYIIVGDGPERNQLEKLVEELELQNNIEFKGNISHEKAMRYMSICDVFSLPSTTETFGLVYIEAMLNEKPVILCKNNAIEGTVIHKENGMVIEGRNIDDLVNSIYFLLKNPSKSKEIAVKGQEIVMKKFIWEQVGQEIEEVYKEIIK